MGTETPTDTTGAATVSTETLRLVESEETGCKANEVAAAEMAVAAAEPPDGGSGMVMIVSTSTEPTFHSWRMMHSGSWHPICAFMLSLNAALAVSS